MDDDDNGCYCSIAEIIQDRTPNCMCSLCLAAVSIITIKWLVQLVG